MKRGYCDLLEETYCHNELPRCTQDGLSSAGAFIMYNKGRGSHQKTHKEAMIANLVYVPTFSLALRKMEANMPTIEPFPLVPATCTHCRT
jgi:hypothetical protein